MNGVDLADLIELIEEKVDWHPDAAAEFRALPIEMRLDVLQQLTRITINPKAGKSLEDKHGMDLTGYRKMYFWRATHRIIYSVEQNGKCKIWGIGPRAGFAVYETVADRTSDL